MVMMMMMMVVLVLVMVEVVEEVVEVVVLIMMLTFALPSSRATNFLRLFKRSNSLPDTQRVRCEE